MTPLTHHEILSLVAPFARAERHVDLQASDRMERRLRFKPFVHQGAAEDHPALTEQLVLENPDEAEYRLTRTLTEPGGLTASLCAQGADPETLLRQISAVAPRWQFAHTPEVAVAFSYRIASSNGGLDRIETDAELALTEAVARLGTTWVRFDFKAVNGSRIPIRIQPTGDEIRQLPPDYLAVLGGAWHRLQPEGEGWRGNLFAPAREPRRTQDGERKVAETAAHLIATLTRSPVEFHPRYQGARWRVVLRNVSAMVGLVAAMAVAPLIVGLMPDNSMMTALAYFWFPALLLALPFAAARIELVPPAWPRTLPASAWQVIAATPCEAMSGELVRSILAARAVH